MEISAFSLVSCPEVVPATYGPANNNDGKHNEQDRYDYFDEWDDGGNSVRVRWYNSLMLWRLALWQVHARWLEREE